MKIEVPKMILKDAVQHAVTQAYGKTQGLSLATPALSGKPGSGKTEILYEICKQYKWGFMNLHFALKPIEETGGIPTFDSMELNGQKINVTDWTYPDIVAQANKMVADLSSDDKIVLINLDDSHLLQAVHMTLLYEMLTEHSIRSFKFDNRVAFILAGNFGSHKAGSRNMFSAIMNRVNFMEIVSDFDAWRDDYALPNRIHNSVVSFLEQDANRDMFHEDEQTDTPWASPRTWTYLANYIRYFEHAHGRRMNDTEVLFIANGHVGKEAASKFHQYYSIFSKFDINAIMNSLKEDKYNLPNDPVDRYALIYASSDHCLNGNYKEYITPFAKLVLKYIEEHQELGVAFCRNIVTVFKHQNQNKLFTDIFGEMNRLKPGSMDRFLEEALDT